ncbi:MAG: exonuclease subunit SbcD, partial [Defluviitaleaceae bacterium]|nr:exonuclease subunit SbcD [Defluviitaleaceae bacterium]
MRFFHISDLHLGIRVNEFSMIGDQRYILADIVRLVGEHKPDAVLIAGDIYDKTVPSIEAVQLLDKFLVQLHELEVAVYLISGNHDSTERMSFAASLLEKSNIHIAQAYNGGLRPIVARDEFGDVNIWLMPYLRPSIVRNHFPSYDIITYSDAVAAVLSCAE